LEVLETRKISECCFFGRKESGSGLALWAWGDVDTQAQAAQLEIKPAIAAVLSGWIDPNKPTVLFPFRH
jgi:hypothetical protein